MHPTGQAIGLVAGGASVQVSGEGSVEVSQATPITKKGEEIVMFSGAEAPDVPMQHATWAIIDPTSVGVRIVPSADTNYAKSMQLVLTPAADMTAGWLTSTATLVWLYGEPVFSSGYRYELNLTQTSPTRIEVRVLAITTV